MIRRKLTGILGASALGMGVLAIGGPASASHLASAVRAQAYVRADVGLPTFNANVSPDSKCATPVQSDTQPVSAPGSTANNVHVDACLFSSTAPSTANVSDVDTAITYELFGVGTISGCPDPDGATGPKTSTVHDHNGDGTNEHCHQSGYQTAGTGALEYHARVNSMTPGQSRVLFCADANQNGCLDESVLSQVAIGWVPAEQSTR